MLCHDRDPLLLVAARLLAASPGCGTGVTDPLAQAAAERPFNPGNAGQRRRLRLGRRGSGGGGAAHRARRARRCATTRCVAAPTTSPIRLGDAQRPREDGRAPRRLPRRRVDHRRRRDARRQQLGGHRAGPVGDAQVTYKFHITYGNGAADAYLPDPRTRRTSPTASAARTASSRAPPATRGPALDADRLRRHAARRRLVRLARRRHLLRLRRPLRQRRPGQRQAVDRRAPRAPPATTRAATGPA